MIRIIFLKIILLIFYLPGLSQNMRKYIDDSTDMKNTQEMRLSLDTVQRSGAGLLLPFAKIRMADVRFDTSGIGTYAVPSFFMIRNVKNYKINLERGPGFSIQRYLNRYFEKNMQPGEQEIVCFLKKLKLLRRDTITESKSMDKTIGQIEFNMEVFLKSGKTYFAAFKIDTVFVATITVNKNEISSQIRDNLLMPSIRLLQSRIYSYDWLQVKNKKPFEEIEVLENYYKKRFNLPILREPYKNGIYLSLAEFVNNQPSIIEFTVRRDGGGISLTDKSGKYINTLKIFGFSKGSRCWIQYGNVSFPLVRNGNSFEYYYTFFANYKFLQTIDLERGLAIQ